MRDFYPNKYQGRTVKITRLHKDYTKGYTGKHIRGQITIFLMYEVVKLLFCWGHRQTDSDSHVCVVPLYDSEYVRSLTIFIRLPLGSFFKG